MTTTATAVKPEAEPTERPAAPIEPTTTPPRNVVEAIVAVMREVTAVGKDGRNTSHNYDFRGIDGTVNALGPVMRKWGLIVSPQLRTIEYGEVTVGQNRTKQAHAQVEVEYVFRFSDADGKITELSVYVPGESMDSGDKSTAKAMSVAFRICLLQTFAIPTMQRDPDEDSYERSSGPEPIPAHALRNAVERASEQPDLEAGFDTLLRFYGERLAVSTVTDNGETLTGDVFVARAKEAAEASRTEAARAQQDSDAQGATRSPEVQEKLDKVQEQVDSATPLQTNVGGETVPTGRNAVAERAQVNEQERAQRAASTPAKTRQEQHAELALEEAAYQAEVLGADFNTYCSVFLDTPGDFTTVHLAKATRFLVRARPGVIEALRTKGDATPADKYAEAGNQFPLRMGPITGGDEGK
jgi:hypothetical protein